MNFDDRKPSDIALKAVLERLDLPLDPARTSIENVSGEGYPRRSVQGQGTFLGGLEGQRRGF